MDGNRSTLEQVESVIAKWDRDGGLTYRELAHKIVGMVRPTCQICNKEAAIIVEYRDCNHWANMED